MADWLVVYQVSTTIEAEQWEHAVEAGRGRILVTEGVKIDEVWVKRLGADEELAT